MLLVTAEDKVIHTCHNLSEEGKLTGVRWACLRRACNTILGGCMNMHELPSMLQVPVLWPELLLLH